uniref:Putative tRNA/rRNA methyltransferase (SpoU) n=1 Tax=Magnetococcus massalia (strain MO-1) TaxID=451514 RepID=A0A1S7LFW7_MAGMO|nr:Putative tRNA/rRNA methyltransferase (SpoU) [Candidatus Magnetococcus massalia]
MTAPTPLDATPLGGPVFILDRPAHGGNIGSALRAIHNMGFRHLRLVEPRQFPHEDVENYAASAGRFIDTIELFPDIASAVADLNFLVAMTRRLRGQRHHVVTPRQMGEALGPKLIQPEQRIGLLFGTERTGLETIDVERCHWICTIPTEGEVGSLNLAQSIMVVAYEMMMGSGKGRAVVHNPTTDDTLATADEMNRLYAHMQEVLFEIDFIQPDRYKQMMGKLKALFNRASLDHREVTILRGMLTEVTAHCNRKMAKLNRP